MRLHVGERLTGSGPGNQASGYVVTGVVRESPWLGLYAGKKVFHNFDFTAKRPRETDEKEWLDVLIRTIQYPHLDDANYVAGRRALARAEARHILGDRQGNRAIGRLWPEPIDFLEISNTRDAFAFHPRREEEAISPGLEPIIVFAHPHGQPVDDWQKQVLPLASVLTVLAEILEFLRQAHDAGVVLNGLAPEAIWVDRTNGVYFLGTDMVMLPGKGDGLPKWDSAGKVDAGLRERWGRWYPPLRYARGFAPPECFELSRVPDIRSDLFSWGAVGFFLLTGDDPAKIALEQGRPWPEFQSSHLAALERSLRALPPSHVRNWAEQLAVDADALVDEWPANFLALFQHLMNPDARRRPVSVEQLRGWLAEPPPEPVAAAVALRTTDGRARILVDPGRATLDLDLVVRRGIGVRPQTARDGEMVCESPLAAVVEDTDVPAEAADVCYGLFTRSREGSGRSVSSVTHADLIAPDRAGILRWVSSQADSTPRAVQLSPLAREPAGVGLLRQIGMAEDVIQRTLAALEGDRPATCPVCQMEVAGRDRSRHLQEAHGYVEVYGSLLPRELAVERLWDGVFSGADTQANEQLLEIFGRGEPVASGRTDFQSVPQATGGTGTTQRYVAALEEAVGNRFPATGADREGVSLAALEGLLACLRQAAPVEKLVPDLLRAREPRLREMGRELVLPTLMERLRGGKAIPVEVRQLLDQAVPADLLKEKILLCLRLPNLGLDMATANACLAQLQEERPVQCSECRARVRLVDLETHLRRAHGILEYRGVRRSLADMRAFLLDAVCSSSPDAPAWQALEDMARDRYRDEADARLVSWLGQKLRAVDRHQRPWALEAVAEVLAGSGSGSRLFPLLLAPHKLPGMQSLRRWLALETAARLPTPLDPKLVDALHPPLADKHVPRGVRQKAVAALLRSTAKSGPAPRRLLLAYIANTGKLRSIEKLQQLEPLVGQSPEIDALAAELEDQLRMDCPRCRVQLRRAQMVHHLWDRHRLVLDGRRVRDPWRLMEDWLEDYRLEKDQAILERCRDLANKLDPDKGMRRLQRLVLQHGIEDREALGNLLEKARKKQACLCPHCYALIPAAEVSVPEPWSIADTTLESGGYRLALSEQGLFPRLRIETPEEIVYDRREPGRLPTRNGVLAVLVAPMMLAGFLLAERFAPRQLSPAVPLVLAAGVGLLVGGLIYMLWPLSANGPDRLVDWSWSLLVAEYFPEDVSRPEADFLAGLARISLNRGNPEKRAGPLQAALEALEKLAGITPLTTHHSPLTSLMPHLAALWRLAAQDQAHFKGDPAAVLAEQVGRCFTARMPLSFAGHLLKHLEPPKTEADDTQTGWSTGEVRRLRILLCDQAFSAGLELSDLVDLGRADPQLGEVLALDDLDGLAQLHYLWSMRENRPWERVGPAITVFELAGRPRAGNRALDAFHDLLLAVEGAPLNLCQRGVCFQDVLFSTMPTQIDVLSRQNHNKAGYELVVGPERFWFADNPEELARSLEKWFRFYFRDFLVQAGSASARRSADAVRKLLDQSGVACPDCKTKILFRPGEVGITLDEKIAATWI